MSNDYQKPIRTFRTKARALAGTQEFGNGQNGEQVGLRCQLIGGDFDGETVTWYGHFTPRAEERTIEQLQIAGWTGDDFINLPGVGDTEFELVVEEYEGENGSWFKGTFINRMGVAMKNVMSADEKQAFARRMNARMKSSGGPRPQQNQRTNGGGQRPPPPRRDESRGDSDDIPF